MHPRHAEEEILESGRTVLITRCECFVGDTVRRAEHQVNIMIIPRAQDKGSKRGIVTDTLGVILAVFVAAASLSDNVIGKSLLDKTKSLHPSITKTWVDTGFKNALIEHGAKLGIDVEVVPRKAETRGFHVVKRRWVVERSLGWLMMYRRLTRDYETLPASSQAMIHIASITT
ncbi:Transposase [Nonomuraea solani]|uniref:Transposase n=1 Tax=Nonomuraea solani TaxID=1144553 RepID=A0A1H6EWY6_9ACTN|nr:Transposase [Nonomuraea solani]